MSVKFMSNINDAVAKYLEYKEEAKRLAELEREFRNDLVELLKKEMGAKYDDKEKKIKFETEKYKISGKIPVSVSLDKELRDDVNLSIRLEMLKNLKREVSKKFDDEKITDGFLQCFDVKLEINESRYRKYKNTLSDEQLIDSALCFYTTEKDGTPQIEIKEK